MVAREYVDRVLERAHDRVYRRFPDNASLIRSLVDAFGRALIARLTDTPDLKTITRWSLGRNEPTPARLALLRDTAVFYFALLELGLTPASAEQWFRGANPALAFSTPTDALRARRYADVAAAVAKHAVVD